MSKINELIREVGPGARNNKYRVSIPTMGKVIDVLGHSIDMPGVTLGVAEVFLKGRKYQIGGNRADAGTFSLTFYNEEDLTTRKEFITLITNVESPAGPAKQDGIGQSPFYQGEIIIEQLGSDMQVTSTTTLLFAFVTEVGNIEYTDEVGEITSTTVTFAYSGIKTR